MLTHVVFVVDFMNFAKTLKRFIHDDFAEYCSIEELNKCVNFGQF